MDKNSNSTLEPNNNDYSTIGRVLVLDHPGVKFCLVMAHVVTLVSLWACIKMSHDKVEIRHPVFAMVFQEIIVLVVTELVGYVSLLFMMGDYITLWRIIFLFVSVASLQFHQITWLFVTCLRYYSL